MSNTKHRRTFNRQVKRKLDAAFKLINASQSSHCVFDMQERDDYPLVHKEIHDNGFSNNASAIYNNTTLEQSHDSFVNSSVYARNDVNINNNAETSSMAPIAPNTFVKQNFSSKLSKWAIEENISMSALSKLIKILKEDNEIYDQSLPKDPRTLLKTPRTTNVVKMGPGYFYYFGLFNSIKNICLKYDIDVSKNNNFEIAVNIDGLPLTKSSNSSFWPIMASIKSITGLKNKILLVALYYGNAKPPANDLLQDFVNESIHLTTAGFELNSFLCRFKISMIICDAPAKSYILQIKSHTGYYSCTKCDVEGYMINNTVCFPDLHFRNRTDDSFRSKFQNDHHQGKSVIEDVPNFNMIDSVPLDYMHLVCLGVVKRLLCSKRYGWVFGKPPHKLRASDILKISDNLIQLKKYIPCEFGRKTRSLIECKRYKATEFRLFLLYTGPVVLKDVLSSKIYNNFMCLSVAISVLVSPLYSQIDRYANYANNLLELFIKTSVKLYGPDFVSHNVHNLIHLTDCVKQHGPLDNFSAFEFENNMKYLLKKIRKTPKPLEQVIRRSMEECEVFSKSMSNHRTLLPFSLEHSDGPLIDGCHSPQFKKMDLHSFTINVSKCADRFIQLKDEDSSIIEVKNFVQYHGDFALLGYKHLKIEAFFNKPVLSSCFDIHTLKKCKRLCIWNINMIKSKLIVFPYKNSYVSFPLLHT